MIHLEGESQSFIRKEQMLKYILVLLVTVVIGLSAAAQSSRRRVKKPPAAPLPAVSTQRNKPEDPLNPIPQGRISIEELKRKLDAGQPVLIIDNRAGSSWLGSLVKIKGALHIPLSDLESRIEELPRDVEVVTYCT